MSIWDELKHLVFLGDEAFVEKHQELVDQQESDLSEVSAKQQRLNIKPLEYFIAAFSVNKKAGMKAAYLSGGYTLSEIRVAFGVHYLY